MSSWTNWANDFKGEPIRLWMEDHIEVPVVVTILYMVMVLYVPENMMKHRAPYNMKTLNIVWNLLLTIFSFVGAFFTLPRLYEMLVSDGIPLKGIDRFGRSVRKGSVYSCVCEWSPSLFYEGPVGICVCLFILSKIPEMIDTVFLVFQKKRVIFLHWYHHITVMLFCWHAFVSTIPGGLVFAAMNYAVHSVMYAYYLICALGYRSLVRPIAPLITALQIAQMAIGIFVEGFSLYHLHVSGKGCDSNRANVRLGMLMYLSYLVLFCKLFKDSYFPASSPAVKDKVLNGEHSKATNSGADKKKA